MRRAESPTPVAKLIDNAIRSACKARYWPIVIWWKGWEDGRNNSPARGAKGDVEPETALEKMIREHFHQIKTEVRRILVANIHRVEGDQRTALDFQAELEKQLPPKKEEFKEAKNKLEECSYSFEFSTWLRSWGVRFYGFARLFGLFLFEIPLNFLAFLNQGDSLFGTLPTVLAVSVIIPVSSHVAGKLLKAGGLGSRLTGVGFVLVLLSLIFCISIFRLDSFQSIARQHSDIVISSDYVVAAFYLLLQMLFIGVAVVTSYTSDTPKSVEYGNRKEWKSAKDRLKFAIKDLRDAERAEMLVKQGLNKIASELTNLADLKALSLERIDSEFRELIEIYRRSNFRRRKDKETVPLHWLDRSHIPASPSFYIEMKPFSDDDGNFNTAQESFEQHQWRTRRTGRKNGGSK